MVAAPKRPAETFLTSLSVFLIYLSTAPLLSSCLPDKCHGCRETGAGEGGGGEYLSKIPKFRIHFSRFRDRKYDSTFSQYYLYYQTLDMYLKSPLRS